MDIWHLRFSSDGRHALFPTEEARRAAVLVIVHHAARWLVAFGIIDDHLHVELACSRSRAGKLKRAIVLGLRPISGRDFEPPFLKPVESRAHLLHLVSYCIEQPAKHGLGIHPALWSGSCFYDLVGARVIGGLELRVADVLPRYRIRDAWRAAGCAADGVAPLTDSQIRGAGLSALREAAAFATCAHHRLVGRSARETEGRAAVVTLARLVGYRGSDIAAELGVSREAARLAGHRRLTNVWCARRD